VPSCFVDIMSSGCWKSHADTNFLWHVAALTAFVEWCLPDSPKPDSPKLGLRVRVGVSAKRVSAKRD